MEDIPGDLYGTHVRSDESLCLHIGVSVSRSPGGGSKNKGWSQSPRKTTHDSYFESLEK